jgi:hypothetical protein
LNYELPILISDSKNSRTFIVRQPALVEFEFTVSLIEARLLKIVIILLTLFLIECVIVTGVREVEEA